MRPQGARRSFAWLARPMPPCLPKSWLSSHGSRKRGSGVLIQLTMLTFHREVAVTRNDAGSSEVTGASLITA